MSSVPLLLVMIATCVCVYVSVAVELRDGELLIPSVLPCDKPNLPCTAFPQSVVSECVTPAPYMAQVPIPPKPAQSPFFIHVHCTCIIIHVHAPEAAQFS